MSIRSTESPCWRLALVSPSVTYSPETTVAHDDLPVGDGVDAEPLERPGVAGPAAALRFGEQLEGPLQIHGEQLVLVLEAAGVVPLVTLRGLLDVGAVRAVAGNDRQPVRRVDPDDTGGS